MEKEKIKKLKTQIAGKALCTKNAAPFVLWEEIVKAGGIAALGAGIAHLTDANPAAIMTSLYGIGMGIDMMQEKDLSNKDKVGTFAAMIAGTSAMVGLEKIGINPHIAGVTAIAATATVKNIIKTIKIKPGEKESGD